MRSLSFLHPAAGGGLLLWACVVWPEHEHEGLALIGVAIFITVLGLYGKRG